MTLYRIYDQTNQNTLANALTQEQAQQVLKFLQLDQPDCELVIEKYSK